MDESKRKNRKAIDFLKERFPFGSTLVYMGVKMTVLSHSDFCPGDDFGDYPSLRVTYLDVNGVIREVRLEGVELDLLLIQNCIKNDNNNKEARPDEGCKRN